MPNEWSGPVRLHDGGPIITISTPAQARTFLQHANRDGRWSDAWVKCTAAVEGRLSHAEARQAFLKAAH
jgi:hypothetical protein